MRLVWWFVMLAVLVCTVLMLPFLPMERQTLIYVSELAAAGALLFLLMFYRRVIRPYRTIADGMDLLKSQDYASRLNKVGQPEADAIVELFNMLSEQLKSERLTAQEQNMLTGMLMDEMPMGMVVLDFDGRVQSANPAATMLFRSIDGLQSVDAGSCLSDFDTPLSRALASLADGASRIFRFGGTRICRCSRLSFLDRGFRHPFVLIEVLTEEIMAAERKSYSSVIRMISHEVGNTVAGITATLDLLSGDLPEDVRPAVEACGQRCIDMSRFVSRYAEVVKLPEPELVLADVLAEVSGLRIILDNMCSGAGVTLDFLPGDSEGFEAMLDPAMFSQALVNIVKNAVESPGASSVCVRLSAAERNLEICDDGAGIDPAIADRLFSPFFTTKPSGQGLGLMLVGEILSRHGISYTLETGRDGLTRFRMCFPG